MDKEPLNLWCAYPDDLIADEVAQACANLLSDDELARWQSFKFDRHAREFLATHALARIALSHHHSLAPQAWRFSLNSYGKPAAEPECGLRFNLSNSPGMVVCLIASGAEVGVDVEPCARAGKIAELAPEVLSPLELAQLEALREDEKLDRALRLWTLKESYMKARGMGLSLPMKKFSFLFGGTEGIRLELDPDLNDQPERWRFCSLHHAGHRIALMVERASAPKLLICETSPLGAPPAPLTADGTSWFPLERAASKAKRP
ncbi:MAG: 4'-phosphopantetheinyl transferase family protein [Terracidiphilus sp.]